MKLNGFVGKGSGKLGSSVFAISGGEQIVREYNPRVANPNTDAQVAQRSKMKLMSQLAAALAPSLAFKKKGLKSARNMFVSKNIGSVDYANLVASVPLTDLKLTDGNAPFPKISVVGGENHAITVSTDSQIPTDVEKAVIVVTTSTEDNKLSLLQVVTADVKTTHQLNQTINLENGGDLIVFAYGWKPTSSSSNVYYADYNAAADEDVATLDSVMNTLLNNGVFTDTTAKTADVE